VYRALHLATKKRVAIKTMHARYAEDDAWVTRFTREAQAAGRIHHPNVVDVYDVGRDGSTPFLVMELLRGVPLSAILEEEGCLPPATLIDLMMPALRGIAAAHAEGIVHRDLKPENVFLVHDAHGDIAGAKVLDFGISKAREDEPSTSLTKTGTVMGTPHYMSLEQIRGRRDVDARTDVYSVGVILYRALSGELPFDADTFPALAVEIATAEVLPLRSYLPDLDPALAAVVARAMERERDRRFESIEALALALEPFGTVRFEERGRSIRGDAPKALASSVETAPTLERAAPAEAIAEVAVTGERKIAKPISDPAPAPTPAPRPSRARLWIGASAALAVLAPAIGFAIWLAVGGLSAPSREIDRHA
ncbi:MAG: serine/threonine protein kinase, partial [Sandaracinaceae bacterium]|nr:serine/threonine protein kinase [Sandaracinaceae bacterium]